MSNPNPDKMGHPDHLDESDWQGIDKTTDDPEEARVMFCALDSFLSVSSSLSSHNLCVLGLLHYASYFFSSSSLPYLIRSQQ